LFFLGTYLFGTEYVAGRRSKGEILVFKRGHIPAEAKIDEETGAIAPGPNISAELSSDEEAKGIEKHTAIFHWKDVCYDIKIKGEPRRLLDHVDGWVKPGTLTALMVSQTNSCEVWELC
jgi:ATP-binding cassette subfamily G (WHITE) protein 2 (PDR)